MNERMNNGLAFVGMKRSGSQLKRNVLVYIH